MYAVVALGEMWQALRHVRQQAARNAAGAPLGVVQERWKQEAMTALAAETAFMRRWGLLEPATAS